MSIESTVTAQVTLHLCLSASLPLSVDHLTTIPSLKFFLRFFLAAVQLFIICGEHAVVDIVREDSLPESACENRCDICQANIIYSSMELHIQQLMLTQSDHIKSHFEFKSTAQSKSNISHLVVHHRNGMLHSQ